MARRWSTLSGEEAMRSPAWNDTENATVCVLYFHMLGLAITDQPYNKAALIREVRQPGKRLADRSRGSIEAKLMNCTAAHRKLRPDYTSMDGHGYRAMANYQASLDGAMQIALDNWERDLPAIVSSAIATGHVA